MLGEPHASPTIPAMLLQSSGNTQERDQLSGEVARLRRAARFPGVGMLVRMLVLPTPRSPAESQRQARRSRTCLDTLAQVFFSLKMALLFKAELISSTPL